MQMKFGELKSVAHNLGHSISSGIGLMIDIFDLDVYGDARNSPSGAIEVDFIRGRISGNPSRKTESGLREYIARGWPELCEKHKVDLTDFSELVISFDQMGSYTVTVQSQDGRGHVQDFERYDGKRTTRKSRLDRLLTEHQARRPPPSGR